MMHRFFRGLIKGFGRLLKQSYLALHCMSRSFWQATCVHNFRAFTIFFVSSEIPCMPSTRLVKQTVYYGYKVDLFLHSGISCL